MEKQPQNKKKISIVAPISLLTMNLIFYILYISMDKPLERLFVIVMALTFTIPFLPVLLSAFLTAGLSEAKYNTNSNKLSNNYNNQCSNKYSFKSKKDKPTIQYKKKVIDDPEYLALRNLIIASSKNKLLSRELILQLKEKINNIIGKDLILYKPFKFQNDMHEIYVKLKSNKFKKDDYILLKNWLSESLKQKQDQIA